MATALIGIGIIPGTNALTNFSTSAISFSGSGDNNLVASAANQTIRCFRIFFVVGGATNLTFKDGSTAQTGAIPMVANGPLVFDFSTEPWFTASSGNALVLNSSSAVQVSGKIWYQQS